MDTRNLFKNLFFCLGILCFGFLAGSPVQATQQSYRIDPGSAISVNEWGTCKLITNPAGGSSLFVPTNTTTEWSDFRIHFPVTITLADCAPTCGTAGVNYETLSSGGQTYYKLCATGQFWTPSTSSVAYWHSTTDWNPVGTCRSLGVQYQACYHCQVTKSGYAGMGWRLPSNAELLALAQSAACAGTAGCFGGDGAYTAPYYWTTQDYDANNAYYVKFNTKTLTYQNKTTTANTRVRCITP